MDISVRFLRIFIVPILALAIIAILGWFLWSEGAFHTTWEAISTRDIPHDDEADISKGMFTELAGWLLTVLTVFVFAEFTRRVTRTEVKKERQKQSAILLLGDHNQMLAWFSRAVKSLADAIRSARVSTPPSKPESHAAATLRATDSDVPSGGDEGSNDTDQQYHHERPVTSVLEALQRHSLFSPPDRRHRIANKEYRENLVLMLAYERFLRNCTVENGRIEGGKNSFFSLNDQYGEMCRGLAEILHGANGSVVRIQTLNANRLTRRELTNLKAVEEQISENWEIVKRAAQERWKGHERVGDYPDLRG